VYMPAASCSSVKSRRLAEASFAPSVGPWKPMACSVGVLCSACGSAYGSACDSACTVHAQCMWQCIYSAYAVHAQCMWQCMRHLRDAAERLEVGEHGEHVFVLEESDGLEEVIVSHLV